MPDIGKKLVKPVQFKLDKNQHDAPATLAIMHECPYCHSYLFTTYKPKGLGMVVAGASLPCEHFNSTIENGMAVFSKGTDTVGMKGRDQREGNGTVMVRT